MFTIFCGHAFPSGDCTVLDIFYTLTACVGLHALALIGIAKITVIDI